MELAIVFLIFAAVCTHMLDGVHKERNETKSRVFLWALMIMPFVFFFSMQIGLAVLTAVFWFFYVILRAIRVMDGERNKWDQLKPICDSCGKVYANTRKHISFSNWTLYVDKDDESPSHLVCYQCRVKYYDD